MERSAQSWSELALDSLPDPVVVVEPVRDGDVVVDFVYRYANLAACVYNGLERDALLGARMLELFPGLRESGALDLQQQVLTSGRSVTLSDVPYVNEQRGAEELRYDYLMVKAGDAVMVTWRDVTERFLSEHELRSRADTDALTGSTSRSAGLARLQTAMEQGRRAGQGPAVAVVDVDRLKRVNDQHGHPVGDLLLATTAQRIRTAVRHDDLVIRWGGDEFLVALLGVASPDAALVLCEKIRLSLDRPLPSPHADVLGSASVGATVATPSDTVDTVLERADRAMYLAKAEGGNGVRVL